MVTSVKMPESDVFVHATFEALTIDEHPHGVGRPVCQHPPWSQSRHGSRRHCHDWRQRERRWRRQRDVSDQREQRFNEPLARS